MALVLLTMLAACNSDAQRIRDINQAYATPSATTTPISAEIDSVEIQEGDCINSTLPEGVDIESVVIVPCPGAWQYRALNTFDITDADDYPGENYFLRLADEKCDRRYTFILFPLEESWTNRLSHYRTVTCLQESFGLSTTDPAKLDRLVDSGKLDIGECFNDAPETDGLLVEAVDCSGEWQYRILSRFEVVDSGRYPGEDHFDQPAYERCDKQYTRFLFPDADSWAIGDREVVCLQESFGLSTTDKAKLERLTSLAALDVGACFNETPEADYLLVEHVDCSGDWELQITDRFDVPGGDYPGEGYFERQASQKCEASWDYYFSPSPDSWAFGDRAITCAKEPDRAA
ncbi:MAG: septum formation family protein [Dehalococcoidia bacterium]|nr:septum formation family protein [Dehalococcoidia bacterium]